MPSGEVSEPIPLPASRQEDVEAAQRHLDETRLVMSGNRFQPKIVWTIVPRTEAQIRQQIEAGGSAPFSVLTVLPLPRQAINYAGAPLWAQWAYLVMVEVRALFGGDK